jgi:Putative transposase
VNVATVVPNGQQQPWHQADGGADHGAAAHPRLLAGADLQRQDVRKRNPGRRVAAGAPEDESIDVNTQDSADNEKQSFRKAAELCLNFLFAAVSETLTEIARTKLKAQIGFTAVLHTWTQILRFHPHIHCIVPAGGLALNLSRWISTSNKFFLPIDSLREVFRGKLLHKIEQALRQGSIPFPQPEGLALLKRASKKTWDIDIKPPLDGPHHVVRYLSRYVHRIAISNSRILAYDGSEVIFRYKDRADRNKTKTLPLSGEDFSRRFLSHVLPDRFVRIRHYGLLAPRRRKDLARCRELLKAPPAPSTPKDKNWVAAFERIFGRNPLLCPVCKTGIMESRCTLPPLRR